MSFSSGAQRQQGNGSEKHLSILLSLFLDGKEWKVSDTADSRRKKKYKRVDKVENEQNSEGTMNNKRTGVENKKEKK